MNSRQRKTLEAIFSAPAPKNLSWNDLVTLLLALGCDMETDGGSHCAFRRGNQKADFHRPHPGKELKPYQVRDARVFLMKTGVEP
jgi:predicted RNA binding protein YcfA (HicA-like mRNA interferase family)